MPLGTVKWFAKGGWGFIVGEDGQDHFVHHSQIQTDDGWKTLREGETVYYEPARTEKGLAAVNVTPMGRETEK